MSEGRQAVHWDPDREGIEEILGRAEIAGWQEVYSGSNYNFVVGLLDAAFPEPGLAIYKPLRGEAPLWDFPAGHLYKRERAAYLLARFLGWPLIPPTVIREEGPFGPGSLQLWVEFVKGEHFFTMRDRGDQDFREMAAFDWLANNADRKGGHCLLGADGRVWSIDHGLTFNTELKTRTVIWEYVDEPLPDRVLEGIERLLGALDAPEGDVAELVAILPYDQVAALRKRARKLLKRGVFPEFPAGANYRPVPWPPV